MFTIFVHGSAASEQGAADRLRHLADAGHELVLVAASDHPARGLVGWADRTPAVPHDPPPGSWFVTADQTLCGGRQAGLRTILVGPRGSAPRPTRCDTTARDLRDAVLEILAADAMP
jgi:hypothetical protein